MEPDGRPLADDLADEIAAEAARLQNFAYSLTRDRADAEDLVQETVTKAIAAAHRFERGSNLRAWLFTIARNLHLSRLRQASRRPSISVEELVVELPDNPGVLDPVEQQVVARAEIDDLMAAFKLLPPLFAEPLRLTAIEELTYQQTAERLGVPIGTVMSRIYRGRRLLLRHLRSDLQ